MKKLLIVCFILVMALSGCTKQTESMLTKQIFAMDTIIGLQIYTKDKNLIEEVEDFIYHIENLMSRTIEDSEVAEINRQAGVTPVSVSDETFYVLQIADKYHRLTKDAFQVTIKPLVDLWDISSNETDIPTNKEITKIKQYCSSNYLLLNSENKSVYLSEKASGIDLGAIAKGYVADEAIKLLQEHNVSNALISIGGGIHALGGKPNDQPWVIGLQDPIQPSNGHFALFNIFSGSIVTSGDYQRYKIVDGQKYHHILDANTGYPVNNDIASVTIWTKNSIDADALSTAVFVMGIDKGLELIKTIPEVEVMIVKHNKHIVMTKGLEKSIQITDKEFIIDEVR